MSASGALTCTVTAGTRLVYDGEVCTVIGLDADRLTLRDGRGQVRVAHTAAVLSDRATRLLGAAEAAPASVGADFGDLSVAQHDALAVRLAHVREVLTGYRAGFAEHALPGEPRAAYRPSLPLKDRYAAKAKELGISARTLRRWAAALREDGGAGLIDGRSIRPSDVLAGLDERWLATCRAVLQEHTEASRPTVQLVARRIAARLEAEYGPGVVTAPGQGKTRRVLAELTRGTNTFTGSTQGKRSIAARPQGVYGRLRPTRPGEYVLVDTTVLDVFAMEPVTLTWVRAELTIALDLYSRCITGLRLTPVSTKSVDAAVVLFECLRPDSTARTGGGLLPYAGVPHTVVLDDEKVTDSAGGGLPAVAAETLVVDHGKIYLSEHLRSVCQRLGISLQPARPLTPTDKAAVERFFRTLREGLLAALPGYKGPDVHSRGADPEGCAFFFLDELETVIREWIAEVYHVRAHDGLLDAHVPGLRLSPREMFAHGLARAGRLSVPARPDLAYDLLPVAWRTIQHYGVEMNGLRYNGPALTGYRGRTSPYTGAHAGKWPVRYASDDISRIYFQDPADHVWHELVWEHHDQHGQPFSAEALAYARTLAAAQGRGVDESAVLGDLLARWDAGLTRHPAERRMAVRASQQRAARTPCPPAPAWTPPTAASAASAPCETILGDDDAEDELDAAADDEQFYAAAWQVLS